jgi:hypothetical protein
MSNKCESLHPPITVINNKEIQQIQSTISNFPRSCDPLSDKLAPELQPKIKGQWRKITNKSPKHAVCLLTAHENKPDQIVVFKGETVLTTNDSHAKGPFKQSISIQMHFHENNQNIFDVIGFTPIITNSFPVPRGSNTITISLKGAAIGLFDPATGILKLALPLHFHENHFLAGDSDITFLLSTESLNPKGSRLDSAKHVTIGAAATFQSGFLGDKTGALTVKGTLTPYPQHIYSTDCGIDQ